MCDDGPNLRGPLGIPDDLDIRQRFVPTHTLEGSPKLGSFDALSLWDTDNEGRIITSPNMSFIPEFPSIDADGLYIRRDGTWGPHDYTRWPQPYSSQNLHHVCIPISPAVGTSLGEIESASDHDPIVFSDLGEDLWEKSGESEYAHCGTMAYGQYRRDVIDGLIRVFHLYKQRAISRYTTSEFKDGSDGKLVAVLSSLGGKVMERLNTVAEPFYASCSTARELQRIILELIGFVNFISVVRPRLRDPTFSTGVTLPYRGTFCMRAPHVQELFRVGIPVWFVRHVSSMGPVTKIINVVDPLPFSSCISLDRPNYHGTTVYIGDIRVDVTDVRSPFDQTISDSAMSDLLASMRLRPQSDEALPMRGTHVPTADPPTANQHTQPPPPDKRDRDERDTDSRPSKRSCSNRIERISQTHAPSGSLFFSVPDGMYPGQRDLPPVAQPWLKAVTKVGLLTKRRQTETAKYHYPPPFLFTHPNRDRLARYYHNYVRIEPFLRERLKEGSLFGEQSYTIKQWRDILHGDYIQSGDIDKKTASSMVRVLDATLPSGRSAHSDAPGSSRDHGKKKRGKRAEIRVTLGIQGHYTPYSADLVAKWSFTGENVALEDVKSNRTLREAILYEVHGMGFILDLWVTDYKLVPRSGLSSEAVRSRHLLLASVYNGVVGDTNFKISASGMKYLWSDKPSTDAFDAFVRVVRSWPDCPNILLDTDILYSSEALKDTLYEELANFFVTKCIDVLDRLPTIPCYLKE